MKREKKLISGNSSQAITGMEREIIHGVCLKRVAVFFENANFLECKKEDDKRASSFFFYLYFPKGNKNSKIFSFIPSKMQGFFLY